MALYKYAYFIDTIGTGTFSSSSSSSSSTSSSSSSSSSSSRSSSSSSMSSSSSESSSSSALADLTEHCAEQIDPLLGGDPATELPYYSVRDHATSTYTRKAACWAAGIDLSFNSVWNSAAHAPAIYDDDSARCANLITPDAFIASWHFRNTADPVTGDTFRFVEADGTVHTRRLTHRQQIGSTDLYVGKLDSDLDAAIVPVKLPPSNLADYLEFNVASSFLARKVASVGITQRSHSTCRDLYFLSTDTPAFSLSADIVRAAYYESIVDGDSSHPGFMIVNGEAVLLTTWKFGGGGSGSSIHGNLTAIADALVTVGSAHSLTIVDLSEFMTF